MSRIDIYIRKHVACGKAIDEYNVNIKLLQSDSQLTKLFEKEWLKKYESNFKRSINKPEGLPWIHLSMSNKISISKILQTFMIWC